MTETREFLFATQRGSGRGSRQLSYKVMSIVIMTILAWFLVLAIGWAIVPLLR